MTLNTLRYAAPIKIGQSNRKKLAPNPDNPATWSNETLREWVTRTSSGAIDPDALCPIESGIQLLRIPESAFLARIMERHPGYGEKRAKGFYDSLWKLLIDARTKKRREQMKREKLARKQKEKDEHAAYVSELERRADEEGVPRDQVLTPHNLFPQRTTFRH